MKRFVIATVLAACGGSAPPPSSPGPSTPPATERTPEGLKAAAAKLRDKACACGDDQACGSAAKDELATWKAGVGTPMSSDPAVEQQLQITVTDIEGCIRRAAGD